MTAAEVAAALAFKRHARCGWQNVATFAGVNLHDLRRHCDPAYVFALPPKGATPAAAPPASEAVHHRPPYSRAAAILDDIPFGRETLRAMLALGAGPQGRFVRSNAIADQVDGVDSRRIGIAIRSLRSCAVPMVVILDATTIHKSWRLTVAGWNAAQAGGGE